MYERFSNFKFNEIKKNKIHLAGWHGDVIVNNKNYRIGIVLSDTYPNTRPYVFIVDDNLDLQELDTSHQYKQKNLCLYTSDGTENAWHRNYNIVDVVDRFKSFMNLYQKGKHKNVHKTIIDPLSDLTDEKKYVIDFNWYPSNNDKSGYVEFERNPTNKNFYYAINILNNKKKLLESRDNIYFNSYSNKLEKKIIKWIYLKRHRVETILKLKTYKQFMNFIKSKQSIKEFFEEDLSKYIIFTGADRKGILININNGISFSNIIDIDKSRFFARNKGLLDVNVLENKKIAIFGVGSLGSKIVEMLTRAGVGKFTLFDYDQFTPENLSRHTLTTEDLFLNKADAIKNRVRKINPWIKVYSIATSQNILYYDHLYSEVLNLLKEADLIICTTGNEESEHNINYIINDLSNKKIIPTIFTAILGNGFGGRFHKVEIGKTPCYQCIKIQQQRNPKLYKLYTEKTFTETNEHKYGIYSEAGIPGLDVDINIVASITVKMALEILLKKQNPIFKFDSYIWGNQIGWVFDKAFQLKDIRFSKISNCPICGREK